MTHMMMMTLLRSLALIEVLLILLVLYWSAVGPPVAELPGWALVAMGTALGFGLAYVGWVIPHRQAHSEAYHHERRMRTRQDVSSEAAQGKIEALEAKVASLENALQRALKG